MIRFGFDQMIDHIHGGGEQSLDPFLSGRIGKTLGKMALSHAGVADQDDVLSLLDKRKVHEIHDQGFVTLP